jgi:hypothetical protein
MTCAEAEMTNSPGRRLLLRSAFAVPLTVAASAYRGAWADALAKRPSATKTAGYALTSPQRAQTLAASLPADVASQLTVLADGGLGRRACCPTRMTTTRVSRRSRIGGRHWCRRWRFA